MKALKAIGIGLLALMAFAGLMHASNGAVNNEVVRDSIKGYDTARSSGDAASICVHAGLVKEACIQAHDDQCAKEWAETERRDCGEWR